jgi:hypothetical protein
MRLEKKQIVKEDGRYLVYYHFPDTATPEQTLAFQSAEKTTAASPPAAAGGPNDAPKPA